MTVRYVMSSMYHIDDLVQECSISSALAMEILQSCNKPSICGLCLLFINEFLCAMVGEYMSVHMHVQHIYWSVWGKSCPSSWSHYRADTRFAPSQWKMSQSRAVSHWLHTNLESALHYKECCCSVLHNFSIYKISLVFCISVYWYAWQI